jgi:hypothetical protein
MKRCNTVVVSVARTHSARAEQKLPGMAISAACIAVRNKAHQEKTGCLFSVARTRSARAEQKLTGMAISAACIVVRSKVNQQTTRTV